MGDACAMRRRVAGRCCCGGGSGSGRVRSRTARSRPGPRPSALAGARRVLTDSRRARGRPIGSRRSRGRRRRSPASSGCRGRRSGRRSNGPAGPRVEDPDRVGPTAMVGFDETVMQPAHRRRRRRFVTAVVDVATGQILDVFEGRDAIDLRVWLADHAARVAGAGRGRVRRPARGLPLRGHRQRRCSRDVTVVVDPFHIVRLANQAVTRCRQRVQQETLEHRGWKGDPLYDIRKLLLLGAERVDEAGWERIQPSARRRRPRRRGPRLLGRQGEGPRHLPHRRRRPSRRAPRRRDRLVHRTPKPGPSSADSRRRCAVGAPRSSPTITTGASNGPVEAANLIIKQVKRSGRGFRNFANYRLRILLAGGLTRERSTRHETPSPTQVSRVGPVKS